MKQLTIKRPKTQRLRAILLAGLALVLSAMPTAAASASAQQSSSEQDMFKQAAQEFQVPQELLQAVSYFQSRWEDHKGEVSVDGGYGPMNLRTTMQVEDKRGDSTRPIKDKTVAPQGDLTLDKAAQLLKVSPDVLKKDVKQNIRGGAAVLAEQAKQMNGGKVPTNLTDWYAVAGRFLGSTDEQNVQMFVDEIFTMIKDGKSATTSDGQKLSIAASPNAPAPDSVKVKAFSLKMDGPQNQSHSNGQAECPKTDNCRFVPAGYAPNSTDPADYGNYDPANRPKDMKVNYIVIHDTEGSYNSAIAHFQDTHSYVSAHYVIRSSDGAVTQMVPTSNVAWHAGDWYMNMHSIGIEHEGYAATGASWYSEAMYQSSANLVKYLAKKYDIPLDRDHILGHDNMPSLTDSRMPSMHWDPGPYWDWDHYMSLLTGKPGDSNSTNANHKNAVTINPTMSRNVQTVNNCTDPADPTTCSDLTAPSNFVYLRTQPNNSAPLISDKLLHPGNQPGTNKIYDWSAKATTGMQFGLADQQGDWTAIWFSGQKGWFLNPKNAPTASFERAKTIKPKPGVTSIGVYGGAYPETSVYPAGVNGPAQPLLSYTIPADQTYVSDGTVPTDFFYDATVDYSLPHDHEIFRGKDKYIMIWYNHRTMFVKANDVVMQ
jgi:N-acetyl-anhydromuramyl-L-alanine amidase AmpD